MARYTGPVCRYCRREGMKLNLKGIRCSTSKCALERRNFPPGQHGQNRSKLSVYGQQLREKQKIKRVYGVFEKQFRKQFAIANRLKGITGTLLMQILERRLDNVIYRAGFSNSRKLARQIVRHGHIKVNGKKINIPSYILKPGDELTTTDKFKNNKLFIECLDSAATKKAYHWIEFDPETKKAKFLTIPAREDIEEIPLKEQMVVELYSK